jgi:hypothetical protein
MTRVVKDSEGRVTMGLLEARVRHVERQLIPVLGQATTRASR